MNRKPIERLLQVVIVAACVLAMIDWARNFPYPSALIKPFLDPYHRWPTEQVREWVLSGEVDPEFLSFFYRDPERSIPEGENMVSPADGRVIDITVRDGIRYVVIALTFWDVHVQRHPVTGVVTEISTQGDTLMDGEGKNLAFLRKKHSPVQKRICYATEVWDDVCVRLITSYLARRIEVWSKVGDHVVKGERLGRILLGSTVVLEVNERVPLLARIGERVVAGETIMAESPGRDDGGEQVERVK